MLFSPSHAVIGASDLESSIQFLRLFGFDVTGRGRLPDTAAVGLYGIESELDEVTLQVPGASRGWLRLVTTPHPERAFAPLDNRALAIDLFSTHLETSLELAQGAGFEVSPIATHQFGPISIRETEIRGPDHLNINLLEQPAGRRPSILDSEPDRLHSEVHAFVWSAKEIDQRLPFWQQQAKLQKLTDATFDSPGTAAVLGAPDKELELRLVVLADEASHPMRLELIEFLGEPAADHPGFPLCAGLHAPAFSVTDLEETIAALPGADFGPVVDLDGPLHRQARAVSAVAPGELRFELWQEEAS